MRIDVGVVAEQIDRSGYAGLPESFTSQWSADLFDRLMGWSQHVRSYDGGTAPRGPDRVYFSVPPEVLHNFREIVEHPNFTGLCDLMFPDGWQVVEIGCDLLGPDAQNQPWHRDYSGVWPHSTCLAFNIPGLRVEQVTDAMGPFEIALGTHVDDGSSYKNGMFPPQAMYERLERCSQRRYPRPGDMSVRTPLTLHRGTAADSSTRDDPNLRRPMLVVGVVPVDVPTSHRIYATHRYLDGLPPSLRAHIRVTDECARLPLIQEEHGIEGLLMGG